MSQRISLRDKISGPNAVPIERLVERGAQASERVQQHFDDFLKLRVEDLEALQAQLTRDPDADAWRNFFTIVRDIRGSSALAGKMGVNQFCISLETLLQERDPADPRMPSAIASHIDALHIVTLGKAGDELSQTLLAEQLSLAVNALPVTKHGAAR
jgi:hypothetical protein